MILLSYDHGGYHKGSFGVANRAGYLSIRFFCCSDLGGGLVRNIIVPPAHRESSVYKQYNMSARYSWRDVHVYDAATQNYLGGVYQAGSITYANFDNMLRSILLVTIDNFSIRQKSPGNIVTPSDDLVLPGDYEIISGGKILLV